MNKQFLKINIYCKPTINKKYNNSTKKTNEHKYILNSRTVQTQSFPPWQLSQLVDKLHPLTESRQSLVNSTAKFILCNISTRSVVFQGLHFGQFTPRLQIIWTKSDNGKYQLFNQFTLWFMGKSEPTIIKKTE